MAVKKYEESQETKKYGQLMSDLEKQRPKYSSKYQAQIDQTLNNYLNREKFSYDLNADALYNQYKDQYVRQGKLASQDVMGQAAALTGGYGSSYGVTAGNQAYQAYLGQLNNIIPELYQMAYERYNQEGSDMLNAYNLLSDRENADYGKHRDSVGDWQNELNYYANLYNQGRTFDYGAYSDAAAMDYQRERDAIADAQWREQFDWQKSQANKSSGGGGDNSTGNNKKLSDRQRETIENYLDDGKYADAWRYIDDLAERGYNTDELDTYVRDDGFTRYVEYTNARADVTDPESGYKDLLKRLQGIK